MKDIWMLTDELSYAVTTSEEYKQFVQCKEDLKKQPQLLELVNNIRKQNFMLNNADISEQGRWYDEACRINESYKNIDNIEVVNKFLMAEISLCRMIQMIYKSVVKELDLEIDFLDL